MEIDASDRPDEVTRLLAVGLIAGDLSPWAIARYAEVPVALAVAAVASAQEQGVLGEDGIDALTSARLIAELDRHERAEVHTAVARHLFASGQGHVPEAIGHLRAAGALQASDAVVALADQGGRLCLSLGDYRSARDLLELADELDSSSDSGTRGRRLCDLATAADGLGRVEEARQHLTRAVSLGELAEDAALVARAAVMYTLPVDWYAGDLRATAFLQRAESMDQSLSDQVAIRAARALAEIRIPIATPDGKQYAWVTRPSVAQPLAEQALAESVACSRDVQLLSLMAWRTTHRAPALLDRRREISARALDLAQELRSPSFQVEGAVWLAVDAIESTDRGLYDEALSVARWVSRSDGNPRLRWRAATLALGAALLDDDQEMIDQVRAEVAELSAGSYSPNAFAVDQLFLGQELIGRDDPDELMAVRVDDTPGLANPMVRAGLGYIWARTGEPEIGIQHARRALRGIDSESSYLLVASLVAQVAAFTGDEQLVLDAIEVLTPWADHIAVDGNGWWCNGPVALWLAMLHLRRGEELVARRYLADGEVKARRLNDVRSIRRAEILRKELPGDPLGDQSLMVDLTARERAVLEMLVAGATNQAIAQSLSFSLSTIRNATMSIYRKFDVTGRPEAVAKALSLGLVRVDS